MKKEIFKRGAALVLGAVMTISILPPLASIPKVEAAVQKTKTIRCKVSATHEICVVLTFFYALFFPSQRMSSRPFSWSVSKVDALRYKRIEKK